MIQCCFTYKKYVVISAGSIIDSSYEVFYPDTLMLAQCKSNVVGLSPEKKITFFYYHLIYH